MSHRLDEAQVAREALNYKAIQPPVPDYWELKLNDYQIPRETVAIRIIPAVRIDAALSVIDGPILQFMAQNGKPCGTINNAAPCPGPACP